MIRVMESSPATRSVRRAIVRGVEERWPFRHLLVRDVIDAETLAGLEEWPHEPARVEYTLGRREEHNSTRCYVDAEAIRCHPPARAVAEALSDPGVVADIETRCGIALAGTYLRMEYAQDTDGFWLEPHTDIDVKAFTMFLYLDDGAEPRDWGTDLFSDRSTHARRVPYANNTGLVFVPGADTWHGFLRRRIDGVRRSLIVNFVTGEWRARHELAYPDRPIGS